MIIKLNYSAGQGLGAAACSVSVRVSGTLVMRIGNSLGHIPNDLSKD